jgi:hypothetical protein
MAALDKLHHQREADRRYFAAQSSPQAQSPPEAQSQAENESPPAENQHREADFPFFDELITALGETVANTS